MAPLRRPKPSLSSRQFKGVHGASCKRKLSASLSASNSYGYAYEHRAVSARRCHAWSRTRSGSSALHRSQRDGVERLGGSDSRLLPKPVGRDAGALGLGLLIWPKRRRHRLPPVRPTYHIRNHYQQLRSPADEFGVVADAIGN